MTAPSRVTVCGNARYVDPRPGFRVVGGRIPGLVNGLRQRTTGWSVRDFIGNSAVNVAVPGPAAANFHVDLARDLGSNGPTALKVFAPRNQLWNVVERFDVF
ncbi:hypothetical protein [Mycolicibacter sinensis]|uniref:hypothetical protein n=1 Tax=Mycolicibacter sinensis (strain JDM601) TaxID=875328 RepID=UPI0010427010|nr:hypothetical protein [Mycolicibacter sinensis]